jgi:hypothetical protein
MDDIWVQTIERLLFPSALIIGKLSVARFDTAITAIPPARLSVELFFTPTITNPFSILVRAIFFDGTVLGVYAVESEGSVRVALHGLATKLCIGIAGLSTTVTKIVSTLDRVVWSVSVAGTITQEGWLGDAAPGVTLDGGEPFQAARCLLWLLLCIIFKDSSLATFVSAEDEGVQEGMR